MLSISGPEAGCKTVAEMVDWVDKHFGDRPEREQNYFRAPGRLPKAD